jgi:uncharacterized protein
LQIWKGAAAIYPFVDRVNRSGIPVYLRVGWYDIFTRDAILLYNNLTVPKRLTVRPIDHSQADASAADLDYAAEAHRWFDRWLKGVDNGIQNEPPIHYYMMGSRKKRAWKSSAVWPPANHDSMRLYFAAGHSGTVNSVNDGMLKAQAPSAPELFDRYIVNYETTSGKKSRWQAINWARDYPAMRANDARGLTYTTAPLPADVVATGHPVLHLWLATDAPDLDAFAYLEEVVDRTGTSAYVTEGNLRASHRKLGTPPFDNLSLPYHSHERSDAATIPTGQPVELAFSLLPTSHVFRAGNRIRVTVTFTDADNFDTPVIQPAPRVRLLRDAAHASFIDLHVSR